MTAIFADSFYWVALADNRDAAHGMGLTLTSELANAQIVTTDEVLTEYLNFFAAAPEGIRRRAAHGAQRLLASPVVHVLPQTRASFQAGLQLYAERTDKGYSLTDCISMQMMRREGLTDVLTGDRHFEQEGFKALFRRTT
jgi:predicted nucleic acid-binding protein